MEWKLWVGWRFEISIIRLCTNEEVAIDIILKDEKFTAEKKQTSYWTINIDLSSNKI